MIFTNMNFAMKALRDDARMTIVSVDTGEMDDQLAPIYSTEYWVQDSDQTDEAFHNSIGLHIATLLAEGKAFNLQRHISGADYGRRSNAKLDSLIGA